VVWWIIIGVIIVVIAFCGWCCIVTASIEDDRMERQNKESTSKES